MVDFTDKELVKFKKICELYNRIKGWMLWGEEIDPEFKSFLQPINELRHAFDHLMRIFAFKLGIKRESDEKAMSK